jgi:hypothetical protein
MQCCNQTTPFRTLDAERLQKTKDFLQQFGAPHDFTTTDGRLLKLFLYTPELFDAWVASIGGRIENERLLFDQRRVNWTSFKNHLSPCKFEVDVEKQAFVVPQRQSTSNCILRCNGFGLPIETDKERIFYHLAAGFAYAIFEWGDDVSIPGFFQDGEGAFQKLKELGYREEQIVIFGYCGSSYVAAELKSKHPQSSMTLVQPHTSLLDVVHKTPCIASWIGSFGVSHIETPEACFNNLTKFQQLPPASSGRNCLIIDENNPTAPAHTLESLKKALEGKGPLQVITKPPNLLQEFGYNLHHRIPSVWKEYANFISPQR